MSTGEPGPAGRPTRSRVSGIVLAGGQSTRFGGDKLRVRLDGSTLLDRSVRALAGACAEVIVAISPTGADPELADPGVPIRVVRDARSSGGPVAGLVAALSQVRLPFVLVVGGDMPWLDTTVLSGMADRLDASDVDLVRLTTGDHARPIPFAARTTALARALDSPAGSPGGSIHALQVLLPRAAAIPVGVDEPSLRDVDRPVDLRGGDALRLGPEPRAPSSRRS